MRHRLVQRVALMCLAFSLALGLLPRLVLCVGPGGHHALEPIDAACCDAARDPRGGMTGERLQGGCAAVCIDTPLAVGLSLAARHRSERATPVAPLIVVSVFTPPPARAALDHLLHRATATLFEAAPRTLRTTIHLC